MMNTILNFNCKIHCAGYYKFCRLPSWKRYKTRGSLVPFLFHFGYGWFHPDVGYFLGTPMDKRLSGRQ